jgi:hypothetical protein
VRRGPHNSLRRSDLPAVVQELLPEARLGRLSERDLATLVDAMVKLGWETQLLSLCRERLTGFARVGDAEPLSRLAAEALAEEGADEEALAVAQLAFQQLNLAHHAYAAAALLVRLARNDEAMEWLGFAVRGGLDCAQALRTDPQLAPLRERPDFAPLVADADARSASVQ